MKVFGKVATMLLSLSLCFSAVACNPENNTNNSNNNGGSSNNDIPNTQVGATLADAIIGQLEQANTLTIKLSRESTESTDFKVETEEVKDYSTSELNEIALTIAKTENGYDLKAEITETVTDPSISEEPIVEKETDYLIGGVSYEYNSTFESLLYNPYEISNDFDFSAVSDFFTDEETAELKAIFAEALGTVYDFDSKSISLGVDLKDDANSLIDYVGNLDITTKTVKAVINDALAVIDETLTVDSIFAEIESVDDKTVGDALTAIDAFLTENANTTLQGLKDELLADERIVELLKSQGDLTDEDIQTAKDFVIDEALADYKQVLLDEVFYDAVLTEVLAQDPSNPPPTYAEFVASLTETEGVDSAITYLTKVMLSPMLAITLEQAAGEDGAAELAGMIEMMKCVEMTELKATADVTFDNYFAIDDLDMYMGFAYEIASEEYTMSSTMRFRFSVETISMDVTEITLPEDTDTIFAFWKNAKALEHNTGVVLNSPDYDKETGFSNVEGYFYPDSTDISTCVYFSYEAPTQATNTWEITITRIEYAGNEYTGEALSELLNGDLTYSLTFDFEESGDYITDFVFPENIANG